MKVIGAALLCALLAGTAGAQVRDNGVLVRKGWLGQKVTPDEFQIFHASEFKGAHRVAISVFNVAFPDRNHYTAKTTGVSSAFNMTSRAKVVMDSTLTGVDRETRQRIADKAYARFVAQLTEAGYEVVDPVTLKRLAPEWSTWTAEPNFAPGRYGAYVAPTGMSVYFLPGDRAKRDSSGMFGQQMLAVGTIGDRPQAFTRSAYLAHDADVGMIAVDLVIDYGVFSSSGERRHFGGGASVGFKAGAAIAAGNAVDRATVIHYWGTHSGGFPAIAVLQVPIRSDADFAAAGSSDFDIVADPARFEAAADDVAERGTGRLVAVMTAAK